MFLNHVPRSDTGKDVAVAILAKLYSKQAEFIDFSPQTFTSVLELLKVFDGRSGSGVGSDHFVVRVLLDSLSENLKVPLFAHVFFPNNIPLQVVESRPKSNFGKSGALGGSTEFFF